MRWGDDEVRLDDDGVRWGEDGGWWGEDGGRWGVPVAVGLAAVGVEGEIFGFQCGGQLL